jgi:hypothetical protein
MPSFRIVVVFASLVSLVPAIAGAGSAAPRGVAQSSVNARPFSRVSRRRMDPTTCSSSPSTAFIGGGTSNVVYGNDAGILVGENNEVCDDTSSISGGSSNSITSAGNDYAVSSFIGGGTNNAVNQEFGVIGAGFDNQVSGESSMVGAGNYNSVAGAYDGLVGAGAANTITLASYAFIGSGAHNTIISENGYDIFDAGASYSFIGGGEDNAIVGSAPGVALEAAIAGGGNNNVSASFASILGGNYNSASGQFTSVDGGARNEASGRYADVLGGFANAATGAYAVVAGGDANTAAGTLSLAGGYHADAVHGGSFVWSDYSSGSSVLKDAAANQFLARASGGVYLYSNEAATAGVKLAAGSGTWSSLSDRNAKTAIAPLDDASILAKVASLPVSAWSYRSERGVRHVGPMAQDFYAAFGVGEDDRHITSIDEDGIALAAIKALHEENRQLALQMASIRAHDSAVEARDAALEARVFGSPARSIAR